jgi:hypothetical protein
MSPYILTVGCTPGKEEVTSASPPRWYGDSIIVRRLTLTLF